VPHGSKTKTNVLARRHAGVDARIGIETGDMTLGLVNELRNLGLAVVCLDARHARAAEIRPSDPFAATSGPGFDPWLKLDATFHKRRRAAYSADATYIIESEVAVDGGRTQL
jgi:hypothetical protein